jgi:SsrA-binding protein
MAKKKSPGTLAENRKARHDYNIEDTIEAGIVVLYAYYSNTFHRF